MDMREFQDERASTETCFKLECGHAFHTKCIIQFLTRSNHKCPACNEHKTPEQQLERSGMIHILLKKIKRDERFRLAKAEYIVASKEYKQVLSQLKKETDEWVKKRSAELKFPEIRKYWKSSVSGVRSTAKEIASEKGFQYVGAVKAQDRKPGMYRMKLVDYVLFGTNLFFDNWRLVNPRIFTVL